MTLLRPHFVTRALFFCSVVFIASTARPESWTVIPSPTKADLRAVTMLTSKYGYIAGDEGNFYKTTDGGSTWRVQRIASGFNKSLFAVAQGDSTSFAMTVGENGAIIQKPATTESWTSLSATNNTLRAACLRTDSVPTFMVVGDNGFIGQHQYHASTIAVLDNYGYFLYDSTIYYIGSSEMTSNTSQKLYGITFSIFDGYAVGDSGVVVTTKNRGQVWTKTSVGAAVKLRSVAQIDRNKLIAVGLAGAMWMTTNGGTTWKNVTPPGLTENLNSVSFADIHNGAIVGDHGMILQTSDGGATWARQSLNAFVNLHAVYCVPPTEGFNWLAVGDSGVILQSRYGGATVTYELDKRLVDFGGTPAGSRRNIDITFTNTAPAGYLTVATTLVGSGFTLNTDRLLLDPNTSGKFTVTYAPVDTTTKNMMIIINDDAGWIPDTIRVTGHGLMSIASIPMDTVVFDSALAGRSVDYDIHNNGNAQLTATVVSVSDTNFTVTCDPMAEADGLLHVRVTLKHTLKKDLAATYILRTNEYRKTLDTLHIFAHYTPQVSVHDGITPSGVSGVFYPNPVQSATGTIHVSMQQPATCALRVFDERGVTVQRTDLGYVDGMKDVAVTLPAFASCAYFYEITTTTGMKFTGRIVKQ